VFSFPGRIGKSAFLIRAAVRVVLFAATVFGFPFILFGIAKMSHCAGIGGACGAVALVASTALKPVLFFGFVYSLIGISVRRARDAGLPGIFGLVVPVLMLADYRFGIFGGAHWSYAFSVGAGPIFFPVYMLMALVAIVGLGALPPKAPAPASEAVAASESQAVVPAELSALAAVTPRPFPLPPIPIWTVLAGAMVAAGTVVFSQDNPWQGMMVLIVQLMPIGFPTLVMYSALFYAIWAVVKKRNLAAGSVLVAALLPFAIWLYAAVSVQMAKKHETEHLASIKTEKLTHVPEVLVFQSRSVDGYFRLLGMHGISQIIADGPYSLSSGMMSYTGQTKPHGPVELSKVEKLPDEYLVLKVGRKSSFAEMHKNYAADGGPLELRHVSPGHDDLIAVWYREFDPAPSMPPVLTISGWLRAPNTATTDAVAFNIRQFFDRSISKATVLSRETATDRSG
jgi:uncharacterized membrane protein YhaH (DUF805 family)